jgi:endonuclease/exonuclease/phosphatase family metal-dependent hydrolase
MFIRVAHLTLLGLLASLGCQDAAPLSGPSAPEFAPDQAPVPIVVMTRNMYVGGNVDRVIGALSGVTGENPAEALAAVIQELYVTDLPTRVNALADEIARERPTVVALQEVSAISIPFVPYTADFLAALEQALLVRGLAYSSYGNLNFDFTDIAGMGIRLADSDVLLVESGVDVVSTSHATYACPGLCIPSLPGIGNLTRGWIRVDARIAGKTITFVGTHPESGDGPQIAMLRAGQVQALVASLPSTHPVVLMGDLNDIAGSPAHQVLLGAGFVDTWAALRAGEPGNTCCFESNLLSGTLAKRIDYVMVRDGFTDGTGRLVRGARAEVVGAAEREKVAGPWGAIWPSDHAGVLVSLPPAK